MKKTMIKLVTLGAATSALFACGGGADVDHVTARQALRSNTQLHATTLEGALEFLKDSELFLAGMEQGRDEYYLCEPLPEDRAWDGAEEDCAPVEHAPMELEVAAPAEKLLTFLDSYVLHEGNLELEEGDRVVYLMRGAVACRGISRGEDRDECVAMVDKAEVRLDVTSPQEGDLDLRIQVGPNRHEPVMLHVHRDVVSLEVDLAATKGAVAHVAAAADERVELPAVMEGRVRGELRRHGANKMEASVSVLQAVKVEEGDFRLMVAKAAPMLSVTADGVAKSVTAVSNLGVVDLSLPSHEIHYYGSGEYSGAEVERTTELTYGLHLAGLTGEAVFDAVAETITLTGVGLGTSTTTASIDGDQILGIDLNAQSGRTFDATLSYDAAADSVDVAVSPVFDLKTVWALLAAKDKLADVDDYLLDEVLRITLGGTAPKLRVDEDGVEVLTGKLTLRSKSANVTHTVDAGMCLLADDTTSPDVSTNLPPDAEEPSFVEAAQHPFEGLMVGTCQ